MVLVRPTVVTAALGGVFPSRAELPMYGLQIVRKGRVVWASKPFWFRNVPYTAIFPTLGQMEWRVEFGETAKGLKGTKGFGTLAEAGKKLPAGATVVKVAAEIQRALKGKRAPHRLSPEEYPSRKRRTFHTIDQLRAMLAKA